MSGMSLSAGSSPLHSPKITPHTSPAPRRRSHTPNPVNYMVPTTAADPGAHIIQKETVGGTTYFYTDNTPAPMAGMVRARILWKTNIWNLQGLFVTFLCTAAGFQSENDDPVFIFQENDEAQCFWFHRRCFLRTTFTPPRHPTWPTCSPKPTPRPSSWQMNSDRYPPHPPPPPVASSHCKRRS